MSTSFEAVAPRGLELFLRLFGGGEPSFALVAVEVAPGMAVAAFADRFGPGRIVTAARVRQAQATARAAQIVAVVPAGARWSAVLHSIDQVGPDHLIALPEEARDLSETSGRRALAICADAGAGAFELYEAGELVERSGWRGSELTHFESLRREAPSAGGLELAGALCCELGLEVPAVRPQRDDDGPWLAVSGETTFGEDATLLDLGGSPLVADATIREASNDALPRPTIESAVDQDDGARPGPSFLRGMLLKLVGRVFD
ncbi:MAG: hypothetical protein AAGN46_11115 [Acidobacteriota bacterium]